MSYPYEEMCALLSQIRVLEGILEEALELCTKPRDVLTSRALPIVTAAVEIDAWECQDDD